MVSRRYANDDDAMKNNGNQRVVQLGGCKFPFISKP